MRRKHLAYRLPILTFLLFHSLWLHAQINSPGRDWAGLTLYGTGTVQDSIFVFFSSTETPKTGALRATFSDGSPSDVIWYKYNQTISNPANRFEPIDTVYSVTESHKTGLLKGGYRVSVTRNSDNLTEVYTCWLMIDDVVITSIDTVNNCDYLYLNTKLSPNRYLIPDYFDYWDLSKSSQPVIITLGNTYFNHVAWTASNPLISISNTTLSLTIDEPAPLYDSKYIIQIVNPFERVLAFETNLLIAKAAKADFSVYIDNEDVWADGGSNPEGEAPLKMKLVSNSINTDSIYWNIINDETLFLLGGDSIVENYSALFAEPTEYFPTPEKMVPGTYPVEHVAVKVSSGCRDTMTLIVVVDTSAIKPDAIPNVFSPNGDGANEIFILKDPKTNISSIKSFHIYIFNRTGQRVYEYSGDPKTWGGWDGTIKGIGSEAPDGVYYFIIEAVGWDNRVYKRGKYKGFVHLLRGK